MDGTSLSTGVRRSIHQRGGSKAISALKRLSHFGFPKEEESCDVSVSSKNHSLRSSTSSASLSSILEYLPRCLKKGERDSDSIRSSQSRRIKGSRSLRNLAGEKPHDLRLYNGRYQICTLEDTLRVDEECDVVRISRPKPSRSKIFNKQPRKAPSVPVFRHVL